MTPDAVRSGEWDILLTDHHTHTNFSDGADSLDEMVAAAERAGLTTLYLTDHVRADTTYLPDYVAAVDAARRSTELHLVRGVEAKIMSTSGRLDLPAELAGIEHIAIADHRFPLDDGPARPEDVAAFIGQGELGRRQALELLVDATVRAMRAVPDGLTAHLAHVFSVLPKAGLHESELDRTLLTRLARECRATGTPVELNEKWACPATHTALVLRHAGAQLVAGSDAHASGAVGRWRHARRVFAALEGENIQPHPEATSSWNG